MRFQLQIRRNPNCCRIMNDLEKKSSPRILEGSRSRRVSHSTPPPFEEKATLVSLDPLSFALPPSNRRRATRTDIDDDDRPIPIEKDERSKTIMLPKQDKKPKKGAPAQEIQQAPSPVDQPPSFDNAISGVEPAIRRQRSKSNESMDEFFKDPSTTTTTSFQ